MSVTITVSKRAIRMFDGKPGFIYVPQAPEGLDLTPTVDPEYPEYGACVVPANPWELTVSNANFEAIMAELGYELDPEDGLCGAVDNLDEFIARCEALIGASNLDASFDPGTETVSSVGDRGARIIHCGRRPGYMTDKAQILLGLAQIAKSQDAALTYA